MGATFAGLDEADGMLQQAYRRRLREINDWFRAELARDLGADAPKDDADLAIVALARGYDCLHVVPRDPFTDPMLTLRRRGHVIASTTLPYFRR